MHKLHITTGILALTFVLSACHKEERSGEFCTWDCSENNCSDTLDIQDFFSGSSIMRLEETEKSRIGECDRVIVEDSIIFVLDCRMAHKVFTYKSSDGTFLNAIGETGSSNKEYFWLQDCCVDAEKKRLYVLADMGKVLTYDYQGEWLETRNVSVPVEHMAFNKDKFYFTSTAKGIGSLVVADNGLHILKQHFINTPDDPLLVKVNPVSVSWDGSVIFHRHLDNNIYVLDENDDPHVLYHFDYGSDSISRYQVLGMEEGERMELEKTRRGRLRYFAETDKMAAIFFFDKREPTVSILDKSTGKVYTAPYGSIKDSRLGGTLPTPLEYGLSDGFMCTIESDRVNPSLVVNPSVDGGDNPAIYWWKF